jgi:hypothetical protein
MDKLGVIVPYRNREQHLSEFKKKITKYLNKQGIDFELIIVHQDDAKLFNRGMLLNIGFTYAEKYGCNYVVFHDVDMIPVYADYSYSNFPVHLSDSVYIEDSIRKKLRDNFDEYFGGVTLFSNDVFKKINGFSNKYWGWGYEDTDLLLRCKTAGVELDTIKYKNINPKSKSLFFNGVNTYVKIKNEIDFNKDMSIFVSFYPDTFICDHTKDRDDFPLFSIPGYDTSISYNSFQRYSFVSFDTNGNVLYANSKIKPNYKTNICVTFESREKKIKVYQDGELFGLIEKHKRILDYKNNDSFYLGVGNLNGEQKNYFKGYIDVFAIFSKTLNENEVKNISENNKIENRDSLKLYYDSNHIENYQLVDLSGNNNNGIIVNCDIIDLDLEKYKEVKIPHRRDSTFYTLSHEENGFFDNKWKTQATRWNQLRFHNEVSMNSDLVFGDGLSDLEFTEHGLIKENNITHINVGI